MESIDVNTAEELVDDIQSGALTRLIEGLIPKFWSLIWCVILALVVYFIGSKIIKVIIRWFRKYMVKHDCDAGVETFLSSILKAFLYIILFVMILGLFGITTTSISAAIAGLSISTGFALEGALSNFAGGVLILLTHPFSVGDYIKEDTFANEGTVESITMVYTILTSLEGKRIVVPNGKLANASIVNFTSHGARMINETVGISYSSDIKLAKDIVQDIVDQTSTRIEEEAVNVFVAELGDSAVQIGYRFWVKTDDYWQTKWDTLEEIKSRFDKAQIEICFNQLDVHINQK